MAPDDVSRLDDLDTFLNLAHEHQLSLRKHETQIFHWFYCSHCGADQRLYVTLLSDGWSYCESLSEFRTQISPSFLSGVCLRCQNPYFFIFFNGPDGLELVVLSTVLGGLTSPHTPSSVGFYLDQANRSKNAGAHSAAMAMFRAAVEHILFEQGYQDRMLGPKLKHLEADISSSTAPLWAQNLGTDELHVLNELAEVAIHTNDGDVTRQSAFDKSLLISV